MDDMRERVFELEKECQNMREEFQKLRTKRSWNIFCRRKSHQSDVKDCSAKSQHRENGLFGS